MNAPETTPDTVPWRISLHGGHSGQYCDHAVGTLAEVLEAACDKQFAVFGVTEHAPRTEPFLYDEERQMGWDAAHLDRLFQQYVAELDAYVTAHNGPTHILRGFEAEVVPEAKYLDSDAARWISSLALSTLLPTSPLMVPNTCSKGLSIGSADSKLSPSHTTDRLLR